MVATHYDEIADKYHTVKGNPIKKYSEEYTVFHHLGSIKDKTILDLGCGDGHYAKVFAADGAKEIVGVDYSPEMIARAKDSQKEDTKQILTYMVGDAAKLDLGRTFDLVVAVYILQYSHDEEMLRNMCQSAYNHTAEGGKFLTVTGNPNLTEDHLPAQRVYGADIKPSGYTDGSRIHNKISVGEDFSVEFDNYHWTKPTIERLLKEAGFKDVKWHDMMVDPESSKELGEDYWEPYLSYPAIITIECTK
jgi:toxoflavin synthase